MKNRLNDDDQPIVVLNKYEKLKELLSQTSTWIRFHTLFATSGTTQKPQKQELRMVHVIYRCPIRWSSWQKIFELKKHLLWPYFTYYYCYYNNYWFLNLDIHIFVPTIFRIVCSRKTIGMFYFAKEVRRFFSTSLATEIKMTSNLYNYNHKSCRVFEAVPIYFTDGE